LQPATGDAFQIHTGRMLFATLALAMALQNATPLDQAKRLMDEGNLKEARAILEGTEDHGQAAQHVRQPRTPTCLRSEQVWVVSFDDDGRARGFGKTLLENDDINALATGSA